MRVGEPEPVEEGHDIVDETTVARHRDTGRSAVTAGIEPQQTSKPGE